MQLQVIKVPCLIIIDALNLLQITYCDHCAWFGGTAKTFDKCTCAPHYAIIDFFIAVIITVKYKQQNSRKGNKISMVLKYVMK